MEVERAVCQETKTLSNQNDCFLTDMGGSYNEHSQTRARLVSLRTEVARCKNDIKVSHNQSVPKATTKANPNIKSDTKRRTIRDHIISLGKRDDVPHNDLTMLGNNACKQIPNDCTVIYEEPRKITPTPAKTPERVRIEVIYSKERLKRSQNSTQGGHNLSRTTVLHRNDTNCIRRCFYTEVKTCQSVTAACLVRGPNRDDLHEFFRRPTKSVKEIDDKGSKRDSSISTHHQHRRHPNRLLPMEVSRISESASLIILNPETLRTMSFSCFHPCRNTS